MAWPARSFSIVGAKKEIEDFKNHLQGRRLDVFCLLFGFNGQPKKNRPEIAAALGLSKERVYQLVRSLCRKMKYGRTGPKIRRRHWSLDVFMDQHPEKTLQAETLTE